MSVATFSQDSLKVFNVNDTTLSPAIVPFSSKNQNHGQLTWSGDGKWLAVAPVEQGAGPFPVFKYYDNQLQPMKYVNLSNISSASFFNWTNRNIALGNENGELFVWDLKEKKIGVKVEHTESHPVDFITVNSDDAYIASASLSSNKITLHGLKTNKVVSTISMIKSNHISSLKFCVCKKNLLGASSMESTVCVWDIMRSECIFKTANSHAGTCTDISFSPVSFEMLASVSLTKTLKLYDLRLGKHLLDANIGEPMNSVDIILNGDKVAVGTTGGSIIVYDLKAKKILTNFKAHNNPILSVRMQNLKTSKTYQEVEMNTPDIVDNPSKTLDISVMDIFSPISSNYVKNTSNGMLNQSKMVSFHSTPKIISNSDYEDSFLRKVLSPQPQLNIPTFQSSPYLCPISEKPESIDAIATPRTIKEEPKSSISLPLGGGGDGFDNHNDILNEIRTGQREVLSEITNIKKEINDLKSDFNYKFELLQKNYEKLVEIKQEIYAGSGDSKIEHISHRILINELNESIISNIEKVSDEVLCNSARLKHMYDMLSRFKK